MIEEKLAQFDEEFIKWVENPTLLHKVLRSMFVSLYARILEEDIKTMEGMQMKKGWMPLGFGEDPYNKTLSRLIDSKREALEALNKLKD